MHTSPAGSLIVHCTRKGKGRRGCHGEVTGNGAGHCSHAGGPEMKECRALRTPDTDIGT